MKYFAVTVNATGRNTAKYTLYLFNLLSNPFVTSEVRV